MTALLDALAPAERAALSRHVSRLVVAHAAAHGIDLFDTGDRASRDPVVSER